MRNFYIETYIDGRATPLKGGPHRKNGGFTTLVKMLVDSEPCEVMRINGLIDSEGKLKIFVEDEFGRNLATFEGGR